MSNNDPFGLGSNIPEVDKSQYNDSQYKSQYPYISWSGKAAGGDSWEPGVFRIKASDLKEVPKGWEVKQYRKNPTAAPTEKAVTSLLRVCAIAERERLSIYDEKTKTRSFFPIGTPKDVWSQSGKYGTELQVLVAPFNAPDELWILSNGSWYQTASWSNDPTRSNAPSGFPAGVVQFAEEYMIGAVKYYQQAGKKVSYLPWKCWTWLDLVPLYKDGQPHFVDMGHDTNVNPYTVSFKVGQGTGLDKRYVGDELREYFDAVRANEGLDWVEAWTKGSSQESSDTEENGYGYGDVPPSEIKEDDIPF